MKKLLVFSCLIALSVSTPAGGQGGGHHDDYQPSPYHYEYKVHDDKEYLDFGAEEEGDGKGDVHGAYHVQLPDGRLQHVSYRVDDYNGYIAEVSYDGHAEHPSYQGGHGGGHIGGHGGGYSVGHAGNHIGGHGVGYIDGHARGKQGGAFSGRHGVGERFGKTLKHIEPQQSFSDGTITNANKHTSVDSSFLSDLSNGRSGKAFGRENSKSTFNEPRFSSQAGTGSQEIGNFFGSNSHNSPTIHKSPSKQVQATKTFNSVPQTKNFFKNVGTFKSKSFDPVKSFQSFGSTKPSGSVKSSGFSKNAGSFGIRSGKPIVKSVKPVKSFQSFRSQTTPSKPLKSSGFSKKESFGSRAGVSNFKHSNPITSDFTKSSSSLKSGSSLSQSSGFDKNKESNFVEPKRSNGVSKSSESFGSSQPRFPVRQTVAPKQIQQNSVHNEISHSKPSKATPRFKSHPIGFSEDHQVLSSFKRHRSNVLQGLNIPDRSVEHKSQGSFGQQFSHQNSKPSL